MRNPLDPKASAPRRGSRVLLLAVLCAALGLAQGAAQLLPAPRASAGCTSNSQCLPGQLCCAACGQPDCGRACFVAIKGRCPLFV